MSAVPRTTVNRHTWLKLMRDEAWTRQKGRCIWCKYPMQRAEATAEHMIPRTKNGRDHIGNITAACGDCNQARGSMHHRKFKKLVRKPGYHRDLEIALAQIRYRLWQQTYQACGRIRRLVA